MRMSDSLEKTTERPTSFAASKPCFESSLAMMLDSSSEDESQDKTSDNTSTGVKKGIAPVSE